LKRIYTYIKPSRLLILFEKIHLKNYWLSSFFVLTFVLFDFHGYSTVYYVSSTGNDANKGTSEDFPWRSLNKVNRFFKLEPGDQVLFNRGDEWTGTLTVNASGTADKPIVYGAYGTGDKPRIYGSEVITGWTQHSGNIYKATFKKTITQLFLNGTKMKIARFQNTGYNYISSVQSSTHFTCKEINGSIDYSGARWFGRTNDWTVVTRTVMKSESQKLTLDSEVEFGLDVGEGFILMGKLEFLDSGGEWFYDDATNTVYLWTPNGDTPCNYEVRGSVMDNGIIVNTKKDYIIIRDFEILEQCKKGIWLSSGNKYITILNNVMKNQEQYGFYCYNTANYCSIIQNYTCGQNARGIYAVTANSNISHNISEDIGLFHNVGLNSTDGTLYGVGIDVYGNLAGSENKISYNRISNTGYTGLYFRGKSYIEYNFISHSCLVIDDGGGIYTPSPTSFHSVISNNIILHSIGSSDGLPKVTKHSHGIYLDEPTGNIIVENNTVAYCNGGGIFLHNNGGSEVRYNTSFGNRNGLLVSKEWGINNFHHNIIYSIDKADKSEAIQILARSHNKTVNVIFNNNTYVHHYNNSQIFKRSSMPETAYYDFNGWKTSTKQDLNSTYNGTPLAVSETEKLFYNDTKQPKTYNLGTSIFRDVYGNLVKNSFTLQPFTSKILIGKNFEIINQTPAALDQ
jgi:parallel beta-helix repeat protein